MPLSLAQPASTSQATSIATCSESKPTNRSNSIAADPSDSKTRTIRPRELSILKSWDCPHAKLFRWTTNSWERSMPLKLPWSLTEANRFTEVLWQILSGLPAGRTYTSTKPSEIPAIRDLGSSSPPGQNSNLNSKLNCRKSMRLGPNIFRCGLPTKRRAQNPRRRRWAAGFNLVEVVVAIAILGIGIVALYSSLLSGFRVAQLSREDLRATQVMVELMDTLRLYSWDQIT